MRSLYALVLIVASLSGCAKVVPPTLDPAADVAWRANEAVVALGQIQHVAIELNAAQVCPTPTTCRPALADAQTRIIVTAITTALPAIAASPSGWRSVAIQAVTGIRARLDAAGRMKLQPYLTAALAALQSLEGTVQP